MGQISADLLILLGKLASAGSINRASTEMGLPKSTISRRLKQLEHEVGAILVKRGPRKIGLTDIGQALLERGQRIASEVEFAQMQAMEMQTKLRGELRVSLPIDFGPSWIGYVLGNFATSCPEVDLLVHVNAHDVDISRENYDVAIHLGPFAGTQDLPMRLLARLSRGLYASPDYVARRGLPKSEMELEQHDCVVHDQQVREGIWPLPAPSDRPYATVRRVQTNNIGLIRDMVVRGAGIGILTDVMCASDLHAGRLLRILPDIQLPSFVASATFLHSRQIPRKTRAFIDHLARELKGSAEAGQVVTVPNLV
jgi:DNA-binding transcriptional LysR family regulator